jgi:hypothetical protein
MRVILEPAPGAVMIGKDDKGNEVKLESVAITPFFSSAAGSGGAALGKSVTRQGGVVDTFLLRASGATGKVTNGERPSTKGVVPKIDQQADKKDDNKP